MLDRTADLVDVGEVDHRVDALAEQVQAQGHQAYVAGALAVAEQAAFDPVGARHHRQLGGGHCGAAVVVRVHGQAHILAAGQVAAHPLDLVGVHVRGGALDRGGQVEDDLPVRTRLVDVHDGFAHFECELQLGVDEDLRRVLVAEVLGVLEVLLGELQDGAGAFHRDALALFAVHAEDDAAELRRRRVVQVDGGPLGADQALDGAFNQLLACLRQHRDLHVVGDAVLFDQVPHEVVVGLAGCGETDLDLLVAHADQQVEDLALALGVHGLDQRLVAVAQVSGEPARSFGDGLRGPGSVRQVDRLERLVAVERHATRLLLRNHVNTLP